MISNPNQYKTPERKQHNIFLLLSTRHVTFAPIAEAIRRITIIPYPIFSHSSFSKLISFANIADRSSVIPMLLHTPIVKAAGADSALPVTFRLYVMCTSPFAKCYSIDGKKIPGRAIQLVPILRHIHYTSISTFIVLRCSCDSVTARNFILVSRTSFNAPEMTSSVCLSDSSIYSFAALRSWLIRFCV